MALVRGPFEIKWGDNVITDIEEVNIEHTVASTEFETVQGTTLEIDGSYKVNATITLPCIRHSSTFSFIASIFRSEWWRNVNR